MRDPDTTLSFVVAAYNAGGTLASALDSLVAQTRADWEAVIVDDGSTDDTAAIVQSYSRRDSRFRLVRRPRGGASAARNTGLQHAAAVFAAFLDADDWLDARFAELMLAAIEGHPTAVAAYCSYRRVLSTGEMLPIERSRDLPLDPAGEFARNCVVAIHAVVAPRQALLDVGGMDEDLRTCEDWDLWLRLARAGMAFVEVPECLSFYRMREGSLSSNISRIFDDALTVIGRAAARDTRIPNPLPQFADGVPFDGDLAATVFAIWCGAYEAAAGRDATIYLSKVARVPDLYGFENIIAEVASDDLLIGSSCSRVEEIRARSTVWEKPMLELFQALAEATHSPGLERRLAVALAARLCFEPLPDEPWSFGPILVLRVDLRSIADVEPRPSCDAALIAFTEAGALKYIETGLIDIFHEHPIWGTLSARELVRLAVAEFGPQDILRGGSYRRRPGFWWSLTRLGVTLLPMVAAICIDAVKLGNRRIRIESARDEALSQAIQNFHSSSDPPRSSTECARAIVDQERGKIHPELQASQGPTFSRGSSEDEGPSVNDRYAYWERVFAAPDPWNYSSSYEEAKYKQTLSLFPEKPVSRVLELACAEGMFTQLLAPRAALVLATDISDAALSRARARCVGYGNIEFKQLDFVSDPLPPAQDVIVCSEVLYYVEDEAQLAEVARKIADALAPGGVLISAHARVTRDSPAVTAFDWDDQFGVTTIERVLVENGFELERSLDAELYRVSRFRLSSSPRRHELADVIPVPMGEPIPDEVARQVVWGGAIRGRGDAQENECTLHVPVLMYHRIASDGPQSLARYRTTPEAFDKQMRLLRQNGYYSISSDILAEHLTTYEAFPGRPVLITFDDGYSDFATSAHPVLKRYDLSAELFIVTDRVGESAVWDERFGPPAPLMDWETIRAIRDDGVSFGSHLATHRSADSLSSEDLLREAARSKAVLEAQIAKEVTSVALPYGVSDMRTSPVLKLCGYRLAFLIGDEAAFVGSPPMRIPRVEVRGGWTTAEFAAAVGVPGFRPLTA